MLRRARNYARIIISVWEKAWFAGNKPLKSAFMTLVVVILNCSIPWQFLEIEHQQKKISLNLVLCCWRVYFVK